MYLKRISDKKLSNIDNVGFKALETYVKNDFKYFNYFRKVVKII